MVILSPNEDVTEKIANQICTENAQPEGSSAAAQGAEPRPEGQPQPRGAQDQGVNQNPPSAQTPAKVEPANTNSEPANQVSTFDQSSAQVDPASLPGNTSGMNQVQINYLRRQQQKPPLPSQGNFAAADQGPTPMIGSSIAENYR